MSGLRVKLRAQNLRPPPRKPVSSWMAHECESWPSPLPLSHLRWAWGGTGAQGGTLPWAIDVGSPEPIFSWQSHQTLRVIQEVREALSQAQGMALGVGPSGAAQFLAQGGTLGSGGRSPPAGWRANPGSPEST